MAPNSGPPLTLTTAVDVMPQLTRSATAPVQSASSSSSPYAAAQRSHLAPEDAAARSLRRHGDGDDRRRRPRPGGPESRSRSRRRNRNWKKILWVKQSYPDNFTDQRTFLDSLQRNKHVQAYEFWPLVADTTVIVQQVCSVAIFVACFVGIFTERVSPVAVVGWGSFATFAGWLLWDWWVGKEEEKDKEKEKEEVAEGNATTSNTPTTPSASSSTTNFLTTTTTTTTTTAATRSSSQLNLPSLSLRQHHAGASSTSLQSALSQTSHVVRPLERRPSDSGVRHRPSSPLRAGGRTSQRLGTIKSAALIYFTILGLSPILKSLTRSTSPDSIWSMSFWLLAVNIFFFDYSSSGGGGVGASAGANKKKKQFPASLSTNAALMASTVLASRLPSTGQVFSLTLFSIEVFGLFPVFRRYARHRSWRYHVALTALLVAGAGGGVGLILGSPEGKGGGGGDDGAWPWRSGLAGVLVGALIAVVAMGASSWWLIGLQKYKNAMAGPWDQARPIIISRRQWDDD